MWFHLCTFILQHKVLHVCNFHLYHFRYGSNYVGVFQWHNNRILYHFNCVDCRSIRCHLLYYTNHQTTLAQVKYKFNNIWYNIVGGCMQKTQFTRVSHAHMTKAAENIHLNEKHFFQVTILDKFRQNEIFRIFRVFQKKISQNRTFRKYFRSVFPIFHPFLNSLVAQVIFRAHDFVKSVPFFHHNFKIPKQIRLFLEKQFFLHEWKINK